MEIDKELDNLIKDICLDYTDELVDQMLEESEKFIMQLENEEAAAWLEKVRYNSWVNSLTKGFDLSGSYWGPQNALYVLYAYDPETEHPFAENGHYPLYVGQSGRVNIRLKQHLQNTANEHYSDRISRIKVLPFDGEEGDDVKVRQLYEKSLIDILRPELNTKHTVNRIFGQAKTYVKHEAY